MANSDAVGPHRLDIAIGQRIRERRRDLGMSQQKLADVLGISFQQVQKYERGANRVAFSRLAEMAAALGCRLEDLTEGLSPNREPAELEHWNSLVRSNGALQLLEAYAQLPSDELRSAVLRHVRRLAQLTGARPVVRRQVKPRIRER